MLTLQNIVRLKIDRSRLAAHRDMPLPAYVTRPLIGQFTSLSESVLTALLNIDPAKFKAQLDAARAAGVSYIGENELRNPIGISATTSLIKTGNLLSKSLVVPQDFLHFDRQLDDHFVIGVFVSGRTEDGNLVCSDDIEIAGWATSLDIQKLQAAQPPPTFHTKLPVMTVPCKSLRPISELFEHVSL